VFKITVHRLHHQTGRRYPQHPSQPTSIRVYSSKGSASASVVLFSASDRPQYHRRPPTISDRQSSRTDRWQPPSSTDRGGPRLQQPNQNHKPPPSVPAIAIHLHQPRLLSTATKIYNSSHSSQINSPSATRLLQQQINSTQRLAMAD
jgi:hypothetical protein